MPASRWTMPASPRSCVRGDWLTKGRVQEFEAALAETCGPLRRAVCGRVCISHAAGVAPAYQPARLRWPPCVFRCLLRRRAAFGTSTCHGDGRIRRSAGARGQRRVVIPVDVAGQPADLPGIQAVARAHGAMVIEDAAHALGASYSVEGKEHRAGSCTHTDMAVLSFHPVKHVTTGEGGAILTNDRELHERLCLLRSHGIRRDPSRLTQNPGPWYYEQTALGFNYRITDIQCALGLSQLRKLPAFVARRRELVQRYQEQLADVRHRSVDGTTRSTPSYHLLVAHQGRARTAATVFEALRAPASAQVHYIPVHLQPWYRRAFRPSAR